MSDTATEADFRSARFLDLGQARVCYRRAGQGPALVLLHGFPLSGLTWRKVLPALAQRFTCYAFDLVGLGQTTSTDDADHASPGQGLLFQRALRRLEVSSYALIGNDTGGWIARELALLDAANVTRLGLMNTEMPGHRPPWIPLYQRLAPLPGSAFFLRHMLGSRPVLRSPMGFGGCFENRDLIDGEFRELFIEPLLASRERIVAMARFLDNMKFSRLDQFAELHAKLTMPVALFWGAADPTFPEPIARAMCSQFPNLVGFHSIPRGKLLVHEEQPTEVARLFLEFLPPGA